MTKVENAKARELFEIARSCFHYAPRETPDGKLFERSETGRLLMNAMEKIAALAASPPKVESDEKCVVCNGPKWLAGLPCSIECSHALAAPVESGVVEKLANALAMSQRRDHEMFCVTVSEMRALLALASSKEERVSEPTEAMIEAGAASLRERYTAHVDLEGEARKVYLAMCAAQVGG